VFPPWIEFGLVGCALGVGFWACGWRLRRLSLTDRQSARKDREASSEMRREVERGLDQLEIGLGNLRALRGQVDVQMRHVKATIDALLATIPEAEGLAELVREVPAEADEECPGKGTKPPVPLGKTRPDGFDEPDLN
jgi:hypothetical protein